MRGRANPRGGEGKADAAATPKEDAEDSGTYASVYTVP